MAFRACFGGIEWDRQVPIGGDWAMEWLHNRMTARLTFQDTLPSTCEALFATPQRRS